MTIFEIKKRGPLYNETIDLLVDKFDKKKRGREFWIKRFEKVVRKASSRVRSRNQK